MVLGLLSLVVGSMPPPAPTAALTGTCGKASIAIDLSDTSDPNIMEWTNAMGTTFYGADYEYRGANNFIPAGATDTGEGALPDGVLGEVRIHQQIYQRNADVSGVCRAMPAKTMSLSCLRRTPRPLHGPGSYFGSDIPLWDDPQLLRSDAQASALGDAMGACPAIVMRGNGAVTAADSLPAAVVLMWYLEDAARIELDILKTDIAAQAAVLSADEVALRATRHGGIFERMWEYLCAGDPEYVPFRSG